MSAQELHVDSSSADRRPNIVDVDTLCLVTPISHWAHPNILSGCSRNLLRWETSCPSDSQSAATNEATAARYRYRQLPETRGRYRDARRMLLRVELTALTSPIRMTASPAPAPRFQHSEEDSIDGSTQFFPHQLNNREQERVSKKQRAPAAFIAAQQDIGIDPVEAKSVARRKRNAKKAEAKRDAELPIMGLSGRLTR
ncbi:hypothetical protein OPT61_g7156 [Boeremia exigua]|uniref:Uncharacterized protein n=1 Tax=Boeremia exigua TaxID=749465 RepID=A0ACC2I3R5_9PLEO|nr:hypothetical protein OPT61_g7156 [Boeremia exigua]